MTIHRIQMLYRLYRNSVRWYGPKAHLTNRRRAALRAMIGEL